MPTLYERILEVSADYLRNFHGSFYNFLSNIMEPLFEEESDISWAAVVAQLAEIPGSSTSIGKFSNVPICQLVTVEKMIIKKKKDLYYKR